VATDAIAMGQELRSKSMSAAYSGRPADHDRIAQGWSAQYMPLLERDSCALIPWQHTVCCRVAPWELHPSPTTPYLHGVQSSSVHVLCCAVQDHPLAIGEGQTISAPHMHAICLELLEPHLQPGARVLDVGAGEGAPHNGFGG
jgi:ribosomal protein L11 methylase PrmA